jgi:hypothetical protein
VPTTIGDDTHAQGVLALCPYPLSSPYVAMFSQLLTSPNS